MFLPNPVSQQQEKMKECHSKNKKQPSHEKDHEFRGYLSSFIETVRRCSAWGIENGFLKMPKSVIDAWWKAASYISPADRGGVMSSRVLFAFVVKYSNMSPTCAISQSRCAHLITPVWQMGPSVAHGSYYLWKWLCGQLARCECGLKVIKITLFSHSG